MVSLEELSRDVWGGANPGLHSLLEEMLDIGKRIGKGLQIYQKHGVYAGCCLSERHRPGIYTVWELEPPF